MGYLYILEYSIPTVIEIKVNKDVDNVDVDDIISKLGLNESECNWMYSRSELPLQKYHILDI